MKKGSNLRAALVVVQFGFALTLIISAFAIYRQIDFLKDRDAGYSRDRLVYVPLTGDLKKNYPNFRAELISRNVAASVTRTSTTLTEQWSGTTEMKWRGKPVDERTDIERICVDQQVVKTCGLTLVEGRDFDLEKFSTDSSAALINETAMKLMGFPDPIGEIIHDNGRDWRVVGVVRDFVFTSPFRKVEPIVIFGSQQSWSFGGIYVKLNPNRTVAQSITALADLCSKYNPDYPFEYRFADEAYQRKFEDLEAMKAMAYIFTGMTIFIACLGLLGLTLYLTEARRKEIGIRRVFGASVASIARLISFSSLKPIVLSMAIFAPVGWFLMNEWLQSFAYRERLGIEVFVTGALSIFVIALLTITTHTIKAALDNPAESLRNE